MSELAIQPVPTEYNGIVYRSALEADWAATFTALGIYYQYEPGPVRMPSGAVYDCDFYLPTMRTYCEAKGPHDRRLWKARELAAVLRATEEIPNAFQVIVLRAAGPHAGAVWEPADESPFTPALISCDHCGGYSFTDLWPNYEEFCRRCFSRPNLSLSLCYEPDLPGAVDAGSHLLPMSRAPRRRAS